MKCSRSDVVSVDGRYMEECDGFMNVQFDWKAKKHYWSCPVCLHSSFVFKTQKRISDYQTYREKFMWHMRAAWARWFK